METRKLLLIAFVLIIFTTLFVVTQASQAPLTRDRLPTLGTDSAQPMEMRLAYPDTDYFQVTLAEYDFEPFDPQGWFPVDLTVQEGPFFHVEDFSNVAFVDPIWIPLSGARSLWCGRVERGPQDPEGEDSYPGYGDSWVQFFTSNVVDVLGEVRVSFDARHDFPDDLDSAYFEYREPDGEWIILETLIGTATSTAYLDTIQIPGGQVQFRFRVDTDGVWSDTDWYWDSDGAIVVDNIQVIDDGSTTHFVEDFEDEAQDDLIASSVSGTQTLTWQAGFPEPFGSFAGLVNGSGVLQEVPEPNFTSMWGFFTGSPDNYACGGHPEQAAVPMHFDAADHEASEIKESIRSPFIDLTGMCGELVADLDSLRLEVDVYRDLPIENGVLYHADWRFRQVLSGDTTYTSWRDDHFVYYGPVSGSLWYRKTWSFVLDSSFQGADAVAVQLQLGVWDMYDVWGFPGECHTQAPLFDNVKLVGFNYVPSGTNTPVGQEVVVQPSLPDLVTRPFALSIPEVTACGLTSVNVRDDLPGPPSGWSMVPGADVYEITTTASHTFPVNICTDAPAGFAIGPNVAYSLFQYDTGLGTWVQVPTDLDAVTHEACADVTELGSFVLLYSGATMQWVPPTSGPIDCGGTQTIGLQLTPGLLTNPIRGYHLQIQASPDVALTSDGITIHTLPVGAETWPLVTENGPNDFTIDYAILGTTAGITSEETLLSITLEGVTTGLAEISVSDVILRDLENDPQDVLVGDPAAVEVECIAPGSVIELDVFPGHERVRLNWTDPPDGDLVALEVWRYMLVEMAGDTTAYPWYEHAGIPIFAIDHPYDDFTASPSTDFIGIAAPGVEAFVDDFSVGGPIRGVYYYEVYALDSAGLYSDGAEILNGRATNYWLGDVFSPYDGFVEIDDITRMGSVFGLTYSAFDPVSYHIAEVDVGPTDTGRADGIPATDQVIDFEDLMIFAVNYNTVAPAKKPISEGSLKPSFAWRQLESGDWALELTESCRDLKGVSFSLGLPNGVTPDLEPGFLLQGQEERVFLDGRQAEKYIVDLAVLGRGITISGTGPLFTLRLPNDTLPGEVDILARNAINEILDFSLESQNNNQIPTTFGLSQNYPNPFNPMTTIKFNLSARVAVHLDVYGPDGRRVATLVDQALPAGRHSVVWRGEDHRGARVASGVYFYRLRAGDFVQTHKMTLMK